MISREDKLKRVVDKIVGLPTLPDILANINRLMMNPRTSAKEVGQIISNDPAIASKILRVVNSAFYGFPNRITTITHAIVILGFNTIKSIVLSSSIFKAFGKYSEAEDFDLVELWKHSIAVGAATKTIANRMGYSALEEFFISGLLHDVGKIIIDQFLHEDFLKILKLVNERNILIKDAEEEVLGVTHAEIGSWLFQKWKLSKALVQSIASHHNPLAANEAFKVTSIIHVADIIARAIQLGSGGDKKIPLISEKAWNAVDIPFSEMPLIMKEVDEETEKAMVFLEFTK